MNTQQQDNRAPNVASATLAVASGLPLLVRVHVRKLHGDYAGTVETLDGVVLRQHISSSPSWLAHDLFDRPSAVEFWAQVAPNGYRVVEEANKRHEPQPSKT
jgi:hypothetical protein